MPLAGAVKTARPLASTTSGAPLTVSVRLVTAENASASTVIATGCPGTDGKLGVRTIATFGPTACPLTRSARPRSTTLLPSVRLITTRVSPTWPGPGAQANWPVTVSKLAPSGRPLAAKRRVSSVSASLPATLKRSVSPSATWWFVKASTGARFTSATPTRTVTLSCAPCGSRTAKPSV